jgi:RNA-directed DNA polymerase
LFGLPALAAPRPGLAPLLCRQDDFLGYSFGPHHYKANGHRYLGASPSKKSVQRLKAKVRDVLVPGNTQSWWEVRDTLNRSLRGWSSYFSYGTRRSAFRGVDRYVYERVRDFLARRHKVAGRGTRRFSCEVVYGDRGLLRLERLPFAASSCASR